MLVCIAAYEPNLFITMSVSTLILTFQQCSIEVVRLYGGSCVQHTLAETVRNPCCFSCYGRQFKHRTACKPCVGRIHGPMQHGCKNGTSNDGLSTPKLRIRVFNCFHQMFYYSFFLNLFTKILY